MRGYISPAQVIRANGLCPYTTYASRLHLECPVRFETMDRNCFCGAIRLGPLGKGLQRVIYWSVDGTRMPHLPLWGCRMARARDTDRATTRSVNGHGAGASDDKVHRQLHRFNLPRASLIPPPGLVINIEICRGNENGREERGREEEGEK